MRDASTTTDKVCVTAKSGKAPSTQARARSVLTSSGLRRTLSASTPTSRPTTRYGAHRAALTQPTSAAEPSRFTTTRTPTARVVM